MVASPKRPYMQEIKYIFMSKTGSGSKGGGWPSTTGNPSGGGRTNNPPKK